LLQTPLLLLLSLPPPLLPLQLPMRLCQSESAGRKQTGAQ
jgi:hypothetical protein